MPSSRFERQLPTSLPCQSIAPRGTNRSSPERNTYVDHCSMMLSNSFHRVLSGDTSNLQHVQPPVLLRHRPRCACNMMLGQPALDLYRRIMHVYPSVGPAFLLRVSA